MRLLTLVDFGADCVAVADFNDDGAPEYVVGRAGSTQLAVYDTPGEGSRRTWIELDSFPVAGVDPLSWTGQRDAIVAQDFTSSN